MATNNPRGNFSTTQTKQDLDAVLDDARANRVVGGTFASSNRQNTRQVGAITPDRVNNLQKKNKFNESASDNTKRSTQGAQSGSEERQVANLTDSKPIEVVPASDFDGSIPENVLNDYINQQYHIIWSMVPNSKLPKIQKRIPALNQGRTAGTLDDVRQLIEEDKSVAIASTGEAFRTLEVDLNFSEVLATQNDVFIGDEFVPEVTQKDTAFLNYYNVLKMSMDNMVAPSSNNPYIGAMTTLKMTVAGPHEFELATQLKNLANKLGYKGINIGRVVYRVDVFFSGYNQDSGEWNPRIKLLTRGRGRTVKVISYYVSLVSMPAKVDHTGTTYELSFVPSGHVAYRPEEVTVEASSIFTGERGSKNKIQTFGGFLKKLEENLNCSRLERTHRQIKRNYVFHAPEALKSASFFEDDFASQHGFLDQNKNKGSKVATGTRIDVMTLIESALNDMEIVWDSFLRTDDPSFEKPRIHWSVRFNVVYEGLNRQLGDYDNITLEYIIEPFASYKKATYDDIIEAGRIVSPSAQVARVEEMIRLGMINRVYDYIHTSENTEVIDFNLDLKTYYYNTLYDQAATATASGSMTRLAAANTQAKQNEFDQTEGVNVRQDDIEIPRRQENTIEQSLRRIFGRGLDAPPAKCFLDDDSNPLSVLGGGFQENPKSAFFGSLGGAANEKKERFQVNLDDHLNNDLAKIEITVRGDPIWLLSFYGTESGQTVAPIDQQTTSGQDVDRVLVQPNAARVIFLKIFAPNQGDFINPNRRAASTSCNIIGGFFEVWMVTSDFSNGKFTQKLTAGKINHLNYVENFIGRVRRDKKEEEIQQSSPEDTLRNSTPGVPGT